MDEAEYQMARLNLSEEESHSLKRRALSYGLYLALFYTGSALAALLSDKAFGQLITEALFLAIMLVHLPLKSIFSMKVAIPVGLVSMTITAFAFHWLFTQIAPIASVNEGKSGLTMLYAYLYMVVLAEVSLIIVRRIMKTKISMFG